MHTKRKNIRKRSFKKRRYLKRKTLKRKYKKIYSRRQCGGVGATYPTVGKYHEKVLLRAADPLKQRLEGVAEKIATSSGPLRLPNIILGNAMKAAAGSLALTTTRVTNLFKTLLKNKNRNANAKIDPQSYLAQQLKIIGSTEGSEAKNLITGMPSDVAKLIQPFLTTSERVYSTINEANFDILHKLCRLLRSKIFNCYNRFNGGGPDTEELRLGYIVECCEVIDVLDDVFVRINNSRLQTGDSPLTDTDYFAISRRLYDLIFPQDGQGERGIITENQFSFMYFSSMIALNTIKFWRFLSEDAKNVPFVPNRVFRPDTYDEDKINYHKNIGQIVGRVPRVTLVELGINLSRSVRIRPSLDDPDSVDDPSDPNDPNFNFSMFKQKIKNIPLSQILNHDGVQIQDAEIYFFLELIFKPAFSFWYDYDYAKNEEDPMRLIYYYPLNPDDPTFSPLYLYPSDEAAYVEVTTNSLNGDGDDAGGLAALP